MKKSKFFKDLSAGLKKSITSGMTVATLIRLNEAIKKEKMVMPLLAPPKPNSTTQE
jgi:hypothetical protein